MRAGWESPYVVDGSPGPRRDWVQENIWGLDLVSAATRDAIVTAWATTWASSLFERFEEIPFAAGLAFPLLDHVNEVTRTGVNLARRAEEEWGLETSAETIVPILILHDVDKPLLSAPDGAGSKASPLAEQLPHGVIGAMLLRELGFDHTIVSHVALHALDAPFHLETPEALVLHHADYFSADHVMLSLGLSPFYQKAGRRGGR